MDSLAIHLTDPARMQMSPQSALRGFLAAWLLISTVGFAAAQDFERYRPRLPAERGRGSAELPEPPEPPGGSPRALVENWRAIVFIDSQDRLVKDGREASGVQVVGDLQLLQQGGGSAVGQKYLGGEISLLRINQLVRDIIMYYRNHNQPVVDVSVPDQKISNGVVQVVVTESRVGKVCVKGGCYFDSGVLLGQTRIRSGSRIYESCLNSDLQWLSRNPYRDVDLELSPGDRKGTTDITFNITDTKPWRMYVGYEDTGTRQTGIERTIYGASWSNAFNRDHLLAYQFSASSDFQKLTAHSLIYEIPLKNRDRLQFYASYGEVNSQAVGLLGTNGIAWQAVSKYIHELPACGSFNHQLVSGLEFKRTNTNLEFGGSQVFNSNADVLQFSLSYQGARRNWMGNTQWRIEGVYGPSGIAGRNDDASYQTIRADAEADYFYGRAFFEHSIPLPMRLNFITRATAQWADGNLLPTEQLGFGGYYSVRGYDMRLVNGDSGYFANLELATDPMNLGLLPCDQAQFLLFHDFGGSYNHTLLAGEDPSIDLSSIGIGLRYSVNDRVMIRADYAWQTVPVAIQPQPRDRAHIGVVVSR